MHFARPLYHAWFAAPGQDVIARNRIYGSKLNWRTVCIIRHALGMPCVTIEKRDAEAGFRDERFGKRESIGRRLITGRGQKRRHRFAIFGVPNSNFAVKTARSHPLGRAVVRDRESPILVTGQRVNLFVGFRFELPDDQWMCVFPHCHPVMVNVLCCDYSTSRQADWIWNIWVCLRRRSRT